MAADVVHIAAETDTHATDLEDENTLRKLVSSEL